MFNCIRALLKMFDDGILDENGLSNSLKHYDIGS